MSTCCVYLLCFPSEFSSDAEDAERLKIQQRTDHDAAKFVLSFRNCVPLKIVARIATRWQELRKMHRTWLRGLRGRGQVAALSQYAKDLVPGRRGRVICFVHLNIQFSMACPLSRHRPAGVPSDGA